MPLLLRKAEVDNSLNSYRIFCRISISTSRNFLCFNL